MFAIWHAGLGDRAVEYPVPPLNQGPKHRQAPPPGHVVPPADRPHPLPPQADRGGGRGDGGEGAVLRGRIGCGREEGRAQRSK